MLKTLVFYIYLLRTSIKASISKRGAFLIESSLMVANNLIFFTIWWIFFRQFNDVAGWNFQDMLILMAVGTGSYGLMQILFGGVKDLSKIITNGDLDSFMTQPKNLLLHVVGAKSLSKGWGQLMTAFILVFLGQIASLQTHLLILISMLSGCLVFTSVNIIAHSLPFWLGSVEGLSKKYCDALFLFALYPTNIYSGFMQLVMFTLIPAGIIGYLPVELIRHFSWLQLFTLIVSALSFFSLAFIVFYRGLKKYESGNKFGARL
ncbi:MAG: ABC-2 family transporter protein [Candidatus Protochlamydia sp.]|nr:ABC-2 family transporter protein [Candidatus Protochlamydia sp.]